MQVKVKAETQTLHVPKTLLNLHPPAVDTDSFPSHPLRLRPIAGEQPGFLFTASVLSAKFAARDSRALTLDSPFPFQPLPVLLPCVPLCGNRNIDLCWCRFIGRACWYEKGKCRYAVVGILLGLAMNLTDATLVLLLAARIHGTDEAVRASAKSVVKKLPRSKRDLIYKVIDSRSPLELVDYLAENLDT